eukprot:5668753-Prymnesium_polylepis.1
MCSGTRRTLPYLAVAREGGPSQPMGRGACATFDCALRSRHCLSPASHAEGARRSVRNAVASPSGRSRRILA